MGVTIKCKKTGREMDVGYFGFFKLRAKVAELVGSEVGEHYKKLDGMRYRGSVRFRTLASWFRSMPRSLARFCAIVLSCVSLLP